MKLGIVGLPNVGKTTLFNALTHAQAAATAYAFTSAESNLGVVAVPDADGFGVALAEGFGPRTASRGSVRGAVTTTPTRSRLVTSTNGSTVATRVSWPGVPETLVIVPSGSPGT